MKKLASTFPNMLLSLVLICLVMGGILGAMNHITQKPIAATELKNKTAAIAAVLPEFDNNPIEEATEVEIPGEEGKLKVYPATKGGEVIGYAIETYTKKGFGGEFSLMVGFLPDGAVENFAVLKHAETPGLGAKMDDWFHSDGAPGLIRNMHGVKMQEESPLKVTKDGGKVDAITASTITSRAFIDAFERAYSALKVVQGTATDVASEATPQTSEEASEAQTQEPQPAEVKEQLVQE